MKITVLGGGFAALTAIEKLRKQHPHAQLQLISPNTDFVYYPSLIWIPTGKRSADDIRVPMAKSLGKWNVEHIRAKVTGITQSGRTVITDGGEFTNDALIIAAGGQYIRKLEGMDNAIIPCGGIAEAEAIKNKLAELKGGTIAFGFGANPNEPSAMRGGPIFEFLLGIDAYLRQEGRRDAFELVFFNAAAEPGKRLGPDVPARLAKVFAKKNIKTHLGAKPLRFEADKVVTEKGDFAADLILFIPGMTGPAWAKDIEGITLSPGGFIQADEQCRVVGLEKTYIAGDAGSFPGPDWMPKQAHMANLQAAVAVKNLSTELAGQIPKETYRVELICIIDSFTHGMLIKRTLKGVTMLPPCRLMHYGKMIFEKLYLRKYR